MTKIKKVAIIGAGIAGLTAGYILQTQGIEVELFDKGRSVGGRTSSRRTDWGYLDHGCQYIKVKDPLFKDFLAPWQELLLPWQGRFARWQNGSLDSIAVDTPRLVPPIAMNRLAKAIASNLSVKVSTRIIKLEKKDDLWYLESENGDKYGIYDFVIVTAPPIQAIDLLGGHTPIVKQISEVEMLPCFTLMMSLEEQIQFDVDAIEFEHPILGWLAINSSKPNRGEKTSLVIQSNFTWANTHVDDDRDEVRQILKDTAGEILQQTWGKTLYESTHLWRYAIPSKSNESKSYLDQDNQIGVCGDWCLKGKVEGAFLSAYHLTQKLSS